MEQPPDVIASRREIDITRRCLMCVYRMAESDIKFATDAARVKELSSYMGSISETLKGLQEYENNLMIWSRFSSQLAAQTGYPQDFGAAVSEAETDNEFGKFTKGLGRKASRPSDWKNGLYFDE